MLRAMLRSLLSSGHRLLGTVRRLPASLLVLALLSALVATSASAKDVRVTVGVGSPGDHWVSTMQWRVVERATVAMGSRAGESEERSDDGEPGGPGERTK